jgi:hypothetical protein
MKGVADMKKSAFLVLLTAAGLVAANASATKLERGRAGLDEIPLAVTNAGKETLSCGATLAHWYSQPIGTVAPGAVMKSSLWLQRDTGAVFLLNQLEDRMPVERLWCGKDGESWATRSEIPLERRRGETIGAIVVTCEADAERTGCHPG